MKKNYIFKISCIVCAIMLLTTNLSISVFADDSLTTRYCSGEQCLSYGGQKVLFGSANKYYATTNENETEIVDYSAYSRLSAHEKQFYDKIISTPVGTLEFTINYTPYLTKAEFEAINFTEIMYAVALDHPEIFWYNGYRYGYSYVQSTGQVASIRYILCPPSIQGTTTPVYTASEIPSLNTTMWNEFHRVAKELRLEERSRYSFVRTLHDYLCESVDYVVDNKWCFDPYGTLINKKAVCQGYAETFKMFCDYYDIPVVSITGTANGGAHMWNAVQMEDGIWYLLDITWDDQSPRIYDDFFLIGLDTVDTYFTRKPFSSSHISDGSPYLPSLNYATTEFISKGTDYFNQTYNSYTYIDEQYLALSPFDAPNHNVYYNGLRVDGIDFTTGSKFTTEDGKEWTVIMIGDLDHDGKVTVVDYQDSINRALRDNHAADSIEDTAADVCRDGYLDVLDVYLIQLMQSGLRTDIEVA